VKVCPRGHSDQFTEPSRPLTYSWTGEPAADPFVVSFIIHINVLRWFFLIFLNHMLLCYCGEVLVVVLLLVLLLLRLLLLHVLFLLQQAFLSEKACNVLYYCELRYPAPAGYSCNVRVGTGKVWSMNGVVCTCRRSCGCFMMCVLVPGRWWGA
jgi:hypothetical protein